MDRRLAATGPVDVYALAKLFELPWSNVAHKPKKNGVRVMYFDAMAAADFAQMLIHLETLGFRVDPEPLTSRLLPAIKKRDVISSAEVSVFWYSSVRHKGSPMSVIVDTEPLPPRNKVVEWKSAGYRLVLLTGDDGAPVHLTAHAPRYRHRPNPVKTKCEECGLEYYRGDPDSTASHRKEHKKRMRYLAPKPEARLLAAGAVPSTVLVKTQSPAWLHAHMYDRALAFKREFEYDHVQWGSPKGDDDLDARGILFIDDEGAIVGACAFRLRDWGDRRQWALQWIWFTPSRRRRGHLARQWATLRAEYGDFYVERPVSDAMKAFLAKQGDLRLMDRADGEIPRNKG
jgi:hypothetical protein